MIRRGLGREPAAEACALSARTGGRL